MDNNFPLLDVSPPEGDSYNILFAELAPPQSVQQKITLGRLENNHISLPDPHKNISRLHCEFSFQGKEWVISDNYSANGTYIQRTGEREDIDVRCYEDGFILKEGDTIKILAWLDEDEEPIFWQFTFHDSPTNQIWGFQGKPKYEYNLSEQQLWRVTRDNKEVIKLAKNQRLLIHHMAQRNNEQCQSVLCFHDELIKAVWGDPFGHTRNEVNRIVWEIRKKIEPDAGEPEILCSEHGQGYRLFVKIGE